MGEIDELKARVRALELLAQYLLLETNYLCSTSRGNRPAEMSIALPELVRKMAEHIANKFPAENDRRALEELERILGESETLISGQP